MRIYKIFGIIFIGYILIKAIQIPMTRKSASGIYLNTNYNMKHCCVEAPHKADTLILNENGKFYNSFFGHGTYQINNKLFHTEIKLHAEKIHYHTSLENNLFDKTRIMLNEDFGHYYEKIIK